MLFLKCPPCNPTLKNTPLEDTDPSETLPASPRTGSPILPQDLAQSPWVSLDCLCISHHESTLKGMGLGDRSPRFQFWLTHLPATWLCCCSVAKSFPTLCDPVDCSTPVFPVLHHLLDLLKLLSIELVMPSNHLILCRPVLLLPSILPSIRVISNELALCIRWPKYWSFSFGISPSNVYSELISVLASCLNFLYKMRIIAVPISQCCCEDKMSSWTPIRF